MKVYQQLNLARAEFHTLQLKKTGENKFAGYKYFELGDFLIPALGVFSKHGLTAFISFGTELATMRIVCIEDGSSIELTSPMAEANLKGCHPIQNLGAVETYTRRYLWVAALEIVEHDAIDSSAPVGTNKEAKLKIAALDGIGDGLDASTKEVIHEWAAEATEICRSQSPQESLAFLREKCLEGDERLYLESKLPSDVRSAMRKVNQPKAA